MLMKLPLVSVRLCSNRGDLDAFGVVAIDDVLEDEEEDDGKTPVSDKEGTESELSEVRVEEKEVEEINPSNLTQVSSDLGKLARNCDFDSLISERICCGDMEFGRRAWSLLMASGVEFGVSLTSEEDECFSRAY
ncbi:hypothetical protein U1Q18_003387 [Sarracenia purpurea var. burkii]